MDFGEAKLSDLIPTNRHTRLPEHPKVLSKTPFLSNSYGMYISGQNLTICGFSMAWFGQIEYALALLRRNKI